MIVALEMSPFIIDHVLAIGNKIKLLDERVAS